MIEISELYKYYDNRRAVGPVSVTIEQGQVVGLLGLNGAGKTTTLRILACDLLPTSGSVRVSGMDVVEFPDQVKAKVGYLPDVPPVYPEMTVDEYLSFAARLRGVASQQVPKLVDQAVEQTELGDERSSLIEALSHGYRQRVGIAQAIVHRPEFVVLDEPISGLDPAQIVEMRSLVKSLSGDHTVVVSSHNLPEISETCDRLLVINNGLIVADGTENDLTSKERGMRVELTVRGDGQAPVLAERAESLLRGLPLVREVRLLEPSEAGEGVITLSVSVEGDIRDMVCRKLIENDFGLLELSRSERELESAFLELLAGNSASKSGAVPDREPAEAASQPRTGPATGSEAKEKVS